MIKDGVYVFQAFGFISFSTRTLRWCRLVGQDIPHITIQFLAKSIERRKANGLDVIARDARKIDRRNPNLLRKIVLLDPAASYFLFEVYNNGHNNHLNQQKIVYFAVMTSS